MQSKVQNKSSDQIYIRYGQLNSQDFIDGLGRKISLKPIYYRDTIIDFDENNTFIEEGELHNDELNNTFGRRVFMKGK